MKKVCRILILLLALNSFLYSQTIVSYRDSDGIMFEELDTVPNIFAYSLDNTIYMNGKTFCWKYQYVKDGVEYQFQSLGEKKWNLVEKSLATDSAAQTFTCEVYGDSSINSFSYNKGQSPLHYTFYNGMNKRLPIQEFTGLVENKKNLWMHPPRTFLFKILELNPFPYIKFPIQKKKNWKWKLTIGSQWGNPLWKEWSYTIVNKYHYRIIDTDYQLQTAVGELSCAVVKSTARSRIGTTKATFYFHKSFGFVRIEYVNIDGSTISLDLIEVLEQ